MDGFVYKWTNTINGKWYIGSHKGTTDDGYRHSSIILKRAEKKYGIKNFVREILFEGDYKKDNIKSVEADYLNMYNASNNLMSYNLSNITGPNCFNNSIREKISKTMKGRTYEQIYGKEKALELRKKHSNRLKGKPGHNRGMTQTKESNQKRSEALKGKKKGPMSVEHRKNLSLSHKGNKSGNAAVWKITSPEGETKIVRSLLKYSKENNIPYTRLIRNNKGWKSQKLNKQQGEIHNV